MNMRCLIFFATAIPLFAQVPRFPTATGKSESAITGAPYSATQTTQRIQTLADGTHITQPSPQMVIYRDSAGRTRSEFTLPSPRAGGQSPPVQIIISDPVAGFQYQLNTKGTVAQRFAIPAARSANVQPRPAVNAQSAVPIAAGGAVMTGANRSTTTSESLGTQTIEGLNVEGTRRTTIYAVDCVGNDREIVVTNESWFSKQLQVEVLMKTSDPRMGDITTKLTNVSLVEPDPALFMPPPDNTIKDAVGSAAP